MGDNNKEEEKVLANNQTRIASYVLGDDDAPLYKPEASVGKQHENYCSSQGSITPEKFDANYVHTRKESVEKANPVSSDSIPTVASGQPRQGSWVRNLLQQEDSTTPRHRPVMLESMVPPDSKESRDTSEPGDAPEPLVPGAHAIAGMPSYLEQGASEIDSRSAGMMDDLSSEELATSGATPTSQAVEGLAQATPVAEEGGPQYLPVAHSMQQRKFRRQQEQRRRHYMVVLSFSALAILIIALVVVIVVMSVSNKNDPASAPTTAPSSNINETDALRVIQVEQRILGALDVLGTTAEIQNDPASPHAQALHWILHKDPRRLRADDSNLLQRFILALFYYSTSNGESGWTACNPARSNETDLCYYKLKNGGGLWEGTGLAYTHMQSTHHESLATRWLSVRHECQWAGLFCNNHEDKQIEWIQLEEMNLTGTLPAELSILENLQTLLLASNSLKGPLPSALGGLRNLQIQENQFSGTIPQEWWGYFAGTLEHINLSNNPLDAWTIPPAIGHWSDLKYLTLMDTKITGTIPEEIYQLSKLNRLNLRFNEVTGTIATELGLLTHLEIISYLGNSMPGTLPSEVAQMTNLLELDLMGLGLTGTIPEELYLANYSKLNAIIFRDNRFSGTISTNIGHLTTLGYLYLDQLPNLTGTLPTELGLLTKLEKMVVSATQLTGTVPEELCDLRGGGADRYLSRLKADCEPLEDGHIPMVYPEGCCTKCCNRETGDCIAKTDY